MNLPCFENQTVLNTFSSCHLIIVASFITIFMIIIIATILLIFIGVEYNSWDIILFSSPDADIILYV